MKLAAPENKPLTILSCPSETFRPYLIGSHENLWAFGAERLAHLYRGFLSESVLYVLHVAYVLVRFAVFIVRQKQCVQRDVRRGLQVRGTTPERTLITYCADAVLHTVFYKPSWVFGHRWPKRNSASPLHFWCHYTTVVTCDVTPKGLPERPVEQRINKRVDSRRNIAYPLKDIQAAVPLHYCCTLDRVQKSHW